MERHEIKEFFVFLDTASDRELIEREAALQAAVDVLTAGSDARRDVQFLLRRLREERAARINVAWLRQRRKAQRG